MPAMMFAQRFARTFSIRDRRIMTIEISINEYYSKLRFKTPSD